MKSNFSRHIRQPPHTQLTSNTAISPLTGNFRQISQQTTNNFHTFQLCQRWKLGQRNIEIKFTRSAKLIPLSTHILRQISPKTSCTMTWNIFSLESEIQWKFIMSILESHVQESFRIHQGVNENKLFIMQ